MNNVKNLIICDSKTIFDILNEIKEYLNCYLLFKSKAEIFRLDNLDSYLVLSEKKIENLDNQIIIDNFPIKIKKLIEIININFLEKNFNLQSDIDVGNYKINLNSRVMFNDEASLDLTEKETLIILYLKNNKKPSSVLNLQEAVWKQSSDLDTHTVETHIYRLRKKIKEKFNDQKFIVSLKEGYKLI